MRPPRLPLVEVKEHRNHDGVAQSPIMASRTGVLETTFASADAALAGAPTKVTDFSIVAGPRRTHSRAAGVARRTGVSIATRCTVWLEGAGIGTTARTGAIVLAVVAGLACFEDAVPALG